MQRYGGNTSCVSLQIRDDAPILFDLGTGLRYFGHELTRQDGFAGTALVTHLHWDHTQGLPFFTPLLCPRSSLDVYAPAQDDGRSVAEAFAAMIRPPAFPIELGCFPGSLSFHDVRDDEWEVGSARVVARTIPHVGPTCGYRVEWQGRSVTYMSDHQQPHDGSFSASDGALELAAGADILIHDAQYFPEEFDDRRTWGHCTMEYAVWVAVEAGARRLVLFHHDPTHSDECLDRALAAARRQAARHGVDVVSASEGLSLTL